MQPMWLDYASSRTSHLSQHLKTHSGENKIKTEIREEYGEPLSSGQVKKEPLEIKTEDVKEEYVKKEIKEEIVEEDRLISKPSDITSEEPAL